MDKQTALDKCVRKLKERFNVKEEYITRETIEWFDGDWQVSAFNGTSDLRLRKVQYKFSEGRYKIKNSRVNWEGI